MTSQAKCAIHFSTGSGTLPTASGGMKLTYDVIGARSRQIKRQMCVRARTSQRMCSVTERVEVFDKKNLVAFLAVQQLIHKVLGQQNPISAGAQTSGFSEKNVSDRVIRRVIYSRMVNLIQGKTLPGVLNPAHH